MSSLSKNIESHFGFKVPWIYIVFAVLFLLVILCAFVFFYNQLGLSKLFVILAGISVVAVIFYNPLVGLYLSIFIAFSGIVWGFEIPYGFLGVVFLTGIAWLANIFIKRNFSFPLDKQLLYITGFLFFALFSCFFAYDPIFSLGIFVNFLKLVILYFLIICLITEKKHFVIFLNIIIISVIISVLFGFYSLYVGVATGDLVSLAARVHGLTGDPNILANHALFVLPMFIFGLLHSKSKRIKLVMMAGIFILVLGIITSLSRSGSIGLVFIIGYFFWRLRGNKKIVIAGGLLILLGLFLIPSLFWEHLTTLSDISRDPSLRWRARLYVGAASLFLEHPITGIGLGNFVLISNQFAGKYLVVHNTYLEIAVENGIFGLIMFLLIIFFTFQNFKIGIRLSLEKNDEKMALFGRSLMIGFSGFLITTLFITLHGYFVFWIIFSLSVVYKRISI